MRWWSASNSSVSAQESREMKPAPAVKKSDNPLLAAGQWHHHRRLRPSRSRLIFREFTLTASCRGFMTLLLLMAARSPSSHSAAIYLSKLSKRETFYGCMFQKIYSP
jgi:hypothetical protein